MLYVILCCMSINKHDVFLSKGIQKQENLYYNSSAFARASGAEACTTGIWPCPAVLFILE